MSRITRERAGARVRVARTDSRSGDVRRGSFCAIGDRMLDHLNERHVNREAHTVAEEIAEKAGPCDDIAMGNDTEKGGQLEFYLQIIGWNCAERMKNLRNTT